MLKKLLFASALLGALLTAGVALAQTDTGSTTPRTPTVKPLPVTFPITELGGCTSKDACKFYCDDPAHRDACFAYAQTHGLMTRAQIALAKKLQAQVGPGGCKGEECKNYCEDTSHAQVCLEFAKANGFISKDDANRREEFLKLSSTTPPLPPFERHGTSTGSTPPPRPRLDDRLASSTRPLPGAIGSTTRPEFRDLPRTPRPPPPAPESTSSEQGGSIFFAIWHFLGF